MGGQSTYQRSTLTANHGTYFLDTSVSRSTRDRVKLLRRPSPCNDPRHRRGQTALRAA